MCKKRRKCIEAVTSCIWAAVLSEQGLWPPKVLRSRFLGSASEPHSPLAKHGDHIHWSSLCPTAQGHALSLSYVWSWCQEEICYGSHRVD